MHLNAYLNNAQLPDYCLRDCPEGYRLWIDDDFLSPFRSKDYEDCWYRTMNLDYDNSTKTYYSVPGELDLISHNKSVLDHETNSTG